MVSCPQHRQGSNAKCSGEEVACNIQVPGHPIWLWECFFLGGGRGGEEFLSSS
jgi:hypothetical protein